VYATLDRSSATEPRKPRKGRTSNYIILGSFLVLILSLAYLASQRSVPTSTSPTSTGQKVPYFDLAEHDECWLQNSKVGEAYRVHVNILTDFEGTLVYENVSDILNTVTFSDGSLSTFPPHPFFIPRSDWTAEGTSLNIYIYLPASGSAYNTPQLEVTGAALTFYVYATASGLSTEEYTVSPQLLLVSLDQATGCY